MLGGKKTKEDKQFEKFMERYQLEDLDEKDLVVLQRIANDLFGKGLIKTSMALTFAKIEEQAKVAYLSALVEQNWILMRQLSRLNKNIEKLIEKQKSS